MLVNSPKHSKSSRLVFSSFEKEAGRIEYNSLLAKLVIPTSNIIKRRAYIDIKY